MKCFVIDIKGRKNTWSVHFEATNEQVKAMLDDGIEISYSLGTVPMWLVNLDIPSLTKSFFFLQDLFYFRNPLRKYIKFGD